MNLFMFRARPFEFCALNNGGQTSSGVFFSKCSCRGHTHKRGHKLECVDQPFVCEKNGRAFRLKSSTTLLFKKLQSSLAKMGYSRDLARALLNLARCQHAYIVIAEKS